MNKALFLHMGPGFHADIERTWLKPLNDRVEFWNQPKVYGKDAFLDLVEATAEKITQMHRSSQQKVNVIAHCFGVHIISRLMEKKFPHIGTVLLVGASRPEVGFYNLLSRIQKQANIDDSIHSEIKSFFIKNPAPDKSLFFQLVSILIKIPDFSSYYWSDKKLYEKYLNIGSQFQTIDFQAFSDVMHSFINQKDLSTLANPTYDITFLSGNQDIFIEFESEQTYWKTIYPNSKFKLVNNANHHVHLEWQDFSNFVAK